MILRVLLAGQLLFVNLAFSLRSQETTTAECESKLPPLAPYFTTTIQYNMKNVDRYLLGFCRQPGRNCKQLDQLPHGVLGKSVSMYEAVDDKMNQAEIITYKEYNITLENVTTAVMLTDKLIWNDALTGVQDFINEVTIGYPNGEKFCLTDNVHESSGLDWLFGFDPACGVNHTDNSCGTPSVTSMLHSAGCWQVTNESTVIRGIDVVEYSTIWEIDAWGASLDVKYYWTDPARWVTESGFSRSIPVAAMISGNAMTPENLTVTIEDFIEYQDFFEQEADTLSFLPTSDMYCEGRGLEEDLILKLPEFYSFTTENVWHWQFPGNPREETIVTKRENWYDYGLNLSRVDTRPFDFSHPQDPFEGSQHMITDIQDFNGGVAFQIDKKIGNCSAMALDVDSVGGNNIYVDSDNKLHMKDPLKLFHLDQKFAYNGMHMDRGILMTVFVTTTPVIDTPGQPERNYTTVVYLTSPVYENTETPRQRMIPAMIKSYPQDKYNDKRNWVVYSIFDITPSIPDFSDFDVSACFDQDHVIRLGVSMTYDSKMDISAKYREFKLASTLSIMASGQVAPIRIQHIVVKVHPESGRYDLEFDILDVPPVNLTSADLTDFYKNDLQAVKTNLQREIDRRNFVIPIINLSSGNLTFINSVGIPGTFRKVNLNTEGGILGFETDVNSNIGYTSGAMAGLAFGMIFLGVLVAGAIYFFVFRNNVRAGLPVMRGIDNPLQGLTDFRSNFKK